MQRLRLRSSIVAIRRLLLLLLLGFSTLTLGAAAPDPLDLASLRGKVVLLDFWASWCEPCRHSFPWLNEMQAKYGNRGLVVIGVNVDHERTDADRFLREVPAQFRIVYDSAGTLASRYDLPGMPMSFVIGPNGEVVERHVGFRAALREEREAQLQKLLEKTQ